MILQKLFKIAVEMQNIRFIAKTIASYSWHWKVFLVVNDECFYQYNII